MRLVQRMKKLQSEYLSAAIHIHIHYHRYIHTQTVMPLFKHSMSSDIISYPTTTSQVYQPIFSLPIEIILYSKHLLERSYSSKLSISMMFIKLTKILVLASIVIDSIVCLSVRSSSEVSVNPRDGDVFGKDYGSLHCSFVQQPSKACKAFDIGMKFCSDQTHCQCTPGGGVQCFNWFTCNAKTITKACKDIGCNCDGPNQKRDTAEEGISPLSHY